jgi:hypothetical protein
MTIGAVLASWVLVMLPAVHAEGFLTALFGAWGDGQPRAPAVPLAYANPWSADQEAPISSTPRAALRPSVSAYGRNQAFCVRGCDGRYFPAAGSDRISRAQSCNSFCPASDTELVYGRDIDHAATETGKPYSKLPNAFRYRNEIVAGCTCDGQGPFGLATIRIEDDPTLRKGDLVAAANGLMVTGQGGDRRGASLNLAPAARSALGRDHLVPVVAAE